MAEPEIHAPGAAARVAAPRKLVPEDREAAAQALFRAFWDDPLIGYYFPGEGLRRSLLPLLMRGAIKLAAPYGESFTAGPAPVGGALWLPPGRSKVPLPSVLRIMLPDVWRWRPRALRRFLAVMDELDKKHPKQDHWYLMLLGIDPPRQGQGLGGLLMSDALGRADRDGLGAYLETHKARNVPFYEKHGFAVVEHFRCDGGRGPESWTMHRTPRARV